MLVRLGDVCSIEKGQQIDTSKLSNANKYKYINGGIKESGYYDDYNTEKGAITVSEGGASCGYVNLIDEPFWCGCHCYKLTDSKVSLKYLYFALKANERKIMGLRTGITMPNIRKSSFTDLQVNVDFSSKVQNRVVSDLDKIDVLIDLAKRQVESLSEQVKSLFNEMFGDALTNSKGWDQAPLYKVCRVINGRAYKESELLDSGKYRVLRVGNFFTNNTFYYSDLELDEDKYCSEGDLLFAWSASFGPRIWHGEKVIFHYHIWKLADYESALDKTFFMELLNYQVESLKKGVHGSTMQHFTKSDMEAQLLILPPMDLQRKYSEQIAQIDKLRFNYQRQIEVLQELMDKKMEEYFGENAVND